MWSDSFKLSCTEKLQKTAVTKQVVPNILMGGAPWLCRQQIII
jgi:hypothetical protein